jgi:hypothetical protein
MIFDVPEFVRKAPFDSIRDVELGVPNYATRFD